MTVLHECARYKKVTVITDPKNPEQDLVDKAKAYGVVMDEITCTDGFVFLIEISGDEQ